MSRYWLAYRDEGRIFCKKVRLSPWKVDYTGKVHGTMSGLTAVACKKVVQGLAGPVEAAFLDIGPRSSPKLRSGSIVRIS
jgi:hypothetical protein